MNDFELFLSMSDILTKKVIECINENKFMYLQNGESEADAAYRIGVIISVFMPVQVLKSISKGNKSEDEILRTIKQTYDRFVENDDNDISKKLQQSIH